MLKGSCLCNSLQYEIDGELGPIVMCHCSNCRKANGSAFATNSPIDKKAFRWTGATDALGEYQSSPGVFRQFCRNCGSQLLSRRDAMPDVLRLRIGTLDTKIASKPAMHIFVGSKAEWFDITDHLPQHHERP